MSKKSTEKADSSHESLKINHRSRGTDQLLSVLECLASIDAPVVPNVLAEILGMPRSTLYSMVNQLEARGWLVRQDEGLAPGPQAGMLGLAASRLTDFERRARAMVQELALQTGDLIELNIVDQWKQLIFFCANGRRDSYINSVEGMRYPLPRTSAARVLLVGLPIEMLQRNIPEEDMRMQSGAKLSYAEFHTQIAAAGAVGYAQAAGLIDPYIATLSVPVPDRSGRPIAALCTVLAAEEMRRLFDDRLSRLHQAAERLAQILRFAHWPIGEIALRSIWTEAR